MFNLFKSKTETPSITAILCAYNRPHLLDEQIKALRAQSIPPTEIWLWYNQGDFPQHKLSDPDIKVAYCNHNFKFFGRFAFAMMAQTDYVALFDDDTMPGENWIKTCLDHMETHEGILGPTGIQFIKDTYAPHVKIGWNGKGGPNTAITPVDLVGHAWFLKKDWLKYMWMEDPVSWENGEDIHLSYCAKRYGNIPTYVMPHPKDDLSVWGSTKGDTYGSDEHASWKKNQRQHIALRNKIVKTLIKRGWVPLYQEK